MKALTVCLFLFGSSVFAATEGYDLQMDLSLKGKLVSSPHMIVKAGEKAFVSQKTKTEESFIEVMAAEGSFENHQGILMNITVGTIGKNGKRTILARPQILAKENEPAMIVIGDNNHVEAMSLSVTATRTIL